jgi:hypothetical protein
MKTIDPPGKKAAVKKRVRKPVLPAGATVAKTHDWWVRGAGDAELAGIVAAFGKLNLRDYSDNDKRWKAERLSAARREIRRRRAIHEEEGASLSCELAAEAAGGAEAEAVFFPGGGDRALAAGDRSGGAAGPAD